MITNLSYTSIQPITYHLQKHFCIYSEVLTANTELNLSLGIQADAQVVNTFN
jgi:hypothetical protein